MLTQKNNILAHSQHSPTRARSRKWLVLVSGIPLFGIVAAFGIAPDTVPESLPVQTIVQELSVPAMAASSDAAPLEMWREERIRRGDTIGNLLARIGVGGEDVSQFIRDTGKTRLFRQLIPGKSIHTRINDEGELLDLRYLGTSGKELAVTRSEEGFSFEELAPELETRTVLKSGEIISSLFAATDAADIPDAIAIQIAEIFASDIDFHRDLRKGDRFSVLYEVAYSRGEPVRSGRVVAAEFENQGKTHQAIHFLQDDGRGGYYGPDGRSLRKAFLRSPIEFSRVTSGFSRARYHPVLKEWRAHRGIDYGAPTGTRVRSTADGRVIFAGWKGGYGKMVVVQHQGKFTTAYAHLSRFASGLRVGQRVSQGETIGHVGQTGLATGPHLHYEFRVNGQQQNPLRVVMPEAPPIAAQYRDAFRIHARDAVAQLALINRLQLASTD